MAGDGSTVFATSFFADGVWATGFWASTTADPVEVALPITGTNITVQPLPVTPTNAKD